MTILKGFNGRPFHFTFICPYQGLSCVQFNGLASWWEFCDKSGHEVGCWHLCIYCDYMKGLNWELPVTQLTYPMGYLLSSTDCNQIKATEAALITMHMFNVIFAFYIIITRCIKENLTTFQMDHDAKKPISLSYNNILFSLFKQPNLFHFPPCLSWEVFCNSRNFVQIIYRWIYHVANSNENLSCAI